MTVQKIFEEWLRNGFITTDNKTAAIFVNRDNNRPFPKWREDLTSKANIKNMI